MNAHRSRTTPGRLVAGTVARNLAWAAAALASWSAVTGLVGPVEVGQPAPADEPRADRVSALVERHDCWTAGAAPRPEAEPRHAVVTPRDGRPHVVPAVRGYEIWLHGGGVLHAFCP